jgi:hypothetical protein
MGSTSTADRLRRREAIQIHMDATTPANAITNGSTGNVPDGIAKRKKVAMSR